MSRQAVTRTPRADPWRLGAVAIFVGLPLLLGGAAAANLVAGLTAADAADQKTAMLSRIAAQIDAHRARAGVPRDTAPIYLASTSGSLARAEIQSLLTRLVSEASGRLTETQTFGEGEDATGRVAIQATLDISNTGLLNLLHTIETGLPILTLKEIGVRRAIRPEATGGEPGLRITLVVQGHWRSKAA